MTNSILDIRSFKRHFLFEGDKEENLWDTSSRTLNIEVRLWREESHYVMAMIYSSARTLHGQMLVSKGSIYSFPTVSVYLVPTMWTQWTKLSKPVLKEFLCQKWMLEIYSPTHRLNMLPSLSAAKGCTLTSPLRPRHASRRRVTTNGHAALGMKFCCS